MFVFLSAGRHVPTHRGQSASCGAERWNTLPQCRGPSSSSRMTKVGSRSASGSNRSTLGSTTPRFAAIEVYLGEMGIEVCATEHGKHLGEGLFELRVRHDEVVIRGKAGGEAQGASRARSVLLRLFCHAYGDRVILLLGGYDKGASPSKRHQDAEIRTARKRLRSFQLRLQRQRAGVRRRGG